MSIATRAGVEINIRSIRAEDASLFEPCEIAISWNAAPFNPDGS